MDKHTKEHSYWVDKTDVVSYSKREGENGKMEIMVVYKIDGVKWTGEVLKVRDNDLLVYIY